MEHGLEPNNSNIYNYLSSTSGLSSEQNASLDLSKNTGSENSIDNSNLTFNSLIFPDNSFVQEDSLEERQIEKVEDAQIIEKSKSHLEINPNSDIDDISDILLDKEDKNNIDRKTFTIGEYRVWKTPIGQGSFSDVYKGYHQKTKRVVAIKSLRINRRNNINRVRFEINIMKDLNHPNIIKLYDVIEENDSQIHLVMEYCSGGTLEKFIENREILSEAQVHHYLKDLNLGLKYLRKKNILHRDLKPHNLLISEENSLKISDFGLSTLLENDKMTDTLCGSPLYMAPEVIMNNIYGVKSDLWSVGIIMYQLIYGRHPFNFKNIYELIQEINTKEIDYPSVPVSKNCINLMKTLLVVDNNKRICWGEFFKHPWITQAEFVESGYIISQPIKIGNKKEGFVNDFTIADYNPSFYQYDPITNSEPVVKGQHFKQFLQSSSNSFIKTNNNSKNNYNNTKNNYNNTKNNSNNNNTKNNSNNCNNKNSNSSNNSNNDDRSNNNINSSDQSDQRIVYGATKSLRNSTVRKRIGHRYAVSYYRKKNHPIHQISTNPRTVICTEGIENLDSSIRRDKLEKIRLEKEKLELEKKEKELEKRERELAEREIIKIKVPAVGDSYKESTKEIVEIKPQALTDKLDRPNDVDVENNSRDVSLLSSFYGILSAPFKFFFNNSKI